MKATKEDLHESGRPLTKEEFIQKIKDDNNFSNKWGSLGKIYGKQWRSWTKKKMYLSTDGSYENIYDEADQTVIDQISILINELKTNPDSRRMLVSAWNVGELGTMILPPCHYGFQCYTRELSLKEREKLCSDLGGTWDLPFTEKVADKWNVPKRAISLMYNCRSQDVPLGTPFNIASYGLLLTIIAKMVNMVPDELIGNLGDTHIYKNQIEGVKEQIGRDLTIEERIAIVIRHPKFDVFDFGIGQRDDRDSEHHLLHDHSLCDSYDIPRKTRIPFELPTLKINSGNENWHLLGLDEVIDTFDPEITFTLENYQFHPKIYFPLSN